MKKTANKFGARTGTGGTQKRGVNMWYIILALITVILLSILAAQKEHDIGAGVFCLFVGAVVFFLLSLFIIPMTTGLCEDYSMGTKAGYLINIEEKGIIWKTIGGQLQQGVGEQSSIQTVWDFSVVPGSEIEKRIRNLVGTKTNVVLAYKGWLIMPYRLGSSSVLITDVFEEKQ